jgi:hypothetical protein
MILFHIVVAVRRTARACVFAHEGGGVEGTSVIAGALSMSKNSRQFFNSFQIRAIRRSVVCPQKQQQQQQHLITIQNEQQLFINIKTKLFDTKVKKCLRERQNFLKFEQLTTKH